MRDYNKVMNGRGINGQSSSSQKKFIFNDIRYVKPIYIVNDNQKQTRNLYYDNNPYFLNNNMMANRAKGIFNTSRHSNTSRDMSETSSQRSSKIIRANGLKIAEKPRINKGIVPERQTILTQSRNNQQTKKLFDRNIELQQQNRLLKQQNLRLRQNMRLMEDVHSKQITSLNLKFQSLLKRTQQLQSQLELEIQWKQSKNDSSQIKTSNQSQLFNFVSNTNGGNPNVTSKQMNYQITRIVNSGQNYQRK